MGKKRKDIPHRIKVHRRLQKEIGNKCPFCDRTDVENFNIHHIDNNRENHHFKNLILLCPSCHTHFHNEEGIKRMQQKKRLLSKEFEFSDMESDGTDFDYEAYSMRPENGRSPNNDPNGSKANLRIIDRNNLIIKVRENKKRTWIGFLSIKHRSFGEMSWKYENEYEFGMKRFFLEMVEEDNFVEDTIFVQPFEPSKDYGSELFLRRREN